MELYEQFKDEKINQFPSDKKYLIASGKQHKVKKRISLLSKLIILYNQDRKIKEMIQQHLDLFPDEINRKTDDVAAIKVMVLNYHQHRDISFVHFLFERGMKTCDHIFVLLDHWPELFDQQLFDFLIQQGMKYNQKDYDYDSLYYTVERNDFKRTKYLLDFPGVDPHRLYLQGEYKKNLLCFALQHHDLKIFTLLLEKGLDCNITWKNWRSEHNLVRFSFSMIEKPIEWRLKILELLKKYHCKYLNNSCFYYLEQVSNSETFQIYQWLFDHNIKLKLQDENSYSYNYFFSFMSYLTDVETKEIKDCHFKHLALFLDNFEIKIQDSKEESKKFLDRFYEISEKLLKQNNHLFEYLCRCLDLILNAGITGTPSKTYNFRTGKSYPIARLKSRCVIDRYEKKIITETQICLKLRDFHTAELLEKFIQINKDLSYQQINKKFIQINKDLSYQQINKKYNYDLISTVLSFNPNQTIPLMIDRFGKDLNITIEWIKYRIDMLTDSCFEKLLTVMDCNEKNDKNGNSLVYFLTKTNQEKYQNKIKILLSYPELRLSWNDVDRLTEKTHYKNWQEKKTFDWILSIINPFYLQNDRDKITWDLCLQWIDRTYLTIDPTTLTKKSQNKSIKQTVSFCSEQVKLCCCQNKIFTVPRELIEKNSIFCDLDFESKNLMEIKCSVEVLNKFLSLHLYRSCWDVFADLSAQQTIEMLQLLDKYPIKSLDFTEIERTLALIFKILSKQTTNENFFDQFFQNSFVQNYIYRYKSVPLLISENNYKIRKENKIKITKITKIIEEKEIKNSQRQCRYHYTTDNSRSGQCKKKALLGFQYCRRCIETGRITEIT